MAATDISSWVPVDVESLAIGRDLQRSAIFDGARLRNMNTVQVDVPRLADADVNGGATLTDDTNSADTISMFSYQYNGKFTVDESEFEDSPADAVEQYVAQWMNSFHKAFDNASIGITGARSSTVSDKRPYTSIYKAITTNDTSGAINYSANDNLTQTGTGGLTYDNMNDALGKGEATDFWAPDQGIVFIHPGLLSAVRGIKDTSDRPIFTESTAGFPGGGVRPQYNLFGYRAYFTYGAVTSSSYDMTEVGNKLIVFANRRFLVRGNRVAPESRFIDANINTNSLQHVVQARARQGFVLTVPFGASVLEVDV